MAPSLATCLLLVLPWPDVTIDETRVVAAVDDTASTEEALRRDAEHLLKAAHRTHTWRSHDRARQSLARYLSAHHDSVHAHDMRWEYAEILYAMHDYYAAAREYTRSVEQDRTGKHTPEAAFSAVYCWARCAEMNTFRGKDCRNWSIQKLKKTRPTYRKKSLSGICGIGASCGSSGHYGVKEVVDYSMKEIPFFERQMLAAADTYFQVAQDHREILSVKYACAFVYFRYRHFDEMVESFLSIIKREPSTQLRMVRIMLNSLYMYAKSNIKPEERLVFWNRIHQITRYLLTIEQLVQNEKASRLRFAEELRELAAESGYFASGPLLE